MEACRGAFIDHPSDAGAVRHQESAGRDDATVSTCRRVSDVVQFSEHCRVTARRLRDGYSRRIAVPANAAPWWRAHDNSAEGDTPVMARRISAASKDRNFAVNLMEHLVVPTFVIDAEGKVMIWNRACERLTGIRAAEVVGTREHWRAFYEEPRPCLADVLASGHYEDMGTLYVSAAVPADIGHGLRAENWCVMPKAGQRLYLAVDAGPIYDEGGRLVAVVETLRDMTEHKRAQLALQQLAERDGLTGLANRRSLDAYLDTEWRRGMRQGSPVSLILVDIDHFKRYNDHYGHLKGDECLRTVAASLQAALFRPADLAARYGGEEFAIVLPATDVYGAASVAERLRDVVHGLEIAHEAAPEHGRVTISLGVAGLVAEREGHSDSLVALADAALYRAKAGGRNRFEIAESAAMPVAADTGTGERPG